MLKYMDLAKALRNYFVIDRQHGFTVIVNFEFFIIDSIS